MKFQYVSKGHLEDVAMKKLVKEGEVKPEDLVIFVTRNLDTGQGMSGGPVYFGHDPNDLKNLIIIGVWNGGDPERNK